VHILLTDETKKNTRSGNVYTHAHLIKKDDTTLNGVLQGTTIPQWSCICAACFGPVVV
jgi:hypothetical protein